MKPVEAPAELTGAIRAILEAELNLAPDADDTDLLEEGLLDSLTFVELLYHLEVVFGVRVEPEDMEFENFRSVDRIAAFVHQRRGAPHG